MSPADGHLSALLLDLDGTLVDSEPLHREGYRRFFAARGWDVPDEDPAPVAGARELIVAARASGTPTAIVTSAGPPWVERSLASLGLGLDSVDVVVTALDVVAGKPDPEGFALACERLDADPAVAVAAEDSPAGIRAARAAGVRHVVGITTTHGSDALLAAGAAEVHDDLRPLVRFVSRRP